MQRAERLRSALIALAFLGVIVLATLLLARPSQALTAVAGLLVVVPLVVWFWRSPGSGIYILLGASVVLEEYFLSTFYPDDLGRYIPFFEGIGAWTHAGGIPLSVADVTMLMLFLFWLLRGVATRRLHFDRGTLMQPVGLYTLMVVVGEIHGLATGGNYNTSLWEVRSQGYLFISYVLASNLIKTRRQIDLLVWIFVVGTAIKGFQGVFRFIVDNHAHVQLDLFPHEQAFFYNGFLTLTVILFLYGRMHPMAQRLKWIMLGSLPFVLLSTVANNRRAAVVAIAVGVAGALIVTVVAYPARRRATIAVLLAMAVILPPYYQAFKHSGSNNLIGQPARAFASAFTPDPRDTTSNNYRKNEDGDIIYTMRTSPIIGFGYGKPMYNVFGLTNISYYYEFYLVLPHDSILWIWMRIGTIGYALFWLMIGLSIVQASALYRRARSAYLKGLILFFILMIIQEVIFGYLDLQWTNYRNLITIGIFFAIISKLPAIVAAEEQALPPPVPMRKRRRRHVYIPQPVAVIDGRLQRPESMVGQ